MGTYFFSGPYDEAMTLLVEARDYLSAREGGERHSPDAEGRLVMNREAMRVTSRLTQVMAWLLLQRAVHEGEIDSNEAMRPENRLDGHSVCLFQADDRLPGRLNQLLDRSYRLYTRIDRLDKQMALMSPPLRTGHPELRAVT
jgi:regulator of CtrA degradation